MGPEDCDALVDKLNAFIENSGMIQAAGVEEDGE